MAKRFYDSQRWKNIRNSHLAQNPLCKDCFERGITTAGTQVDHIKPIAEGGSATAVDNLQSLCDTCHSKKTRRENTPTKGISTTLEYSDATVVKESKPSRKKLKYA